MKHLLYLKEISKDQINKILEKADSFLVTKNVIEDKNKIMRGLSLANLFYEPSTRTRGSFHIAAKRLGAEIFNFDDKMSSSEKGETILDTIFTLESMGINYFVIRHIETGIHTMISEKVSNNSHIISAGEGDVSHPSQGLLDLFTIKKSKGDFTRLKIVILGDIQHSRVARSLAEGLNTMSVGQLILVAPEYFKPNMEHFPCAEYTDNIVNGLEGADVVMTLRIQNERMTQSRSNFDIKDYFNNYGLTTERLEACNDSVIIMHPGPMNRGVEITDNVADGERSVIREQVSNGIAVRMALLSIMQDQTNK